MTLSELHSMTVIQLRKFARENQIVLGAGLDKAAMIAKIAQAIDLPLVPVQQSFLDPADGSALFPDAQAGTDAAAGAPEVKPAAEKKASAGKPAEKKPAGVKPAKKRSLEMPQASAPAPEDGGAAHLSDSPLDQLSEEVMEEIAEDVEDAPAGKSAPAADAPEAAAPRFQAAWHSPDAAARSAPHASYSSTGTARPAWLSTTPSGRPLTRDQRPQPLRPHSFGPRFGPSSAVRPESAPEPAPRTAPERPVRPAISPLPDHRIGFTGSGTPFGPAAAAAPVPASVSAPAPASAPSADAPQVAEPSPEASSAPTLEELLSSGDFETGCGILELHPDGYGFLRASNFMPSSRDIYVSMAQIRRFGLRSGDEIQGKIRPQREGDKYSALLYIDAINGMTEEEIAHRPLFEELTPVYPSRRISLEAAEGPSRTEMRLIDLIAPLGFGQRGLLLCPPDTGKRDLLSNYANVISANYPDARVLVLLIDPTPEDVTEFREKVSCPVLASTFDMAPETHLRLTEMVVERAMRLAEQQKDVVILVDSLTRLAKIYSTSAVQQGRSVPGMVNPASLLRAKRMFGAARSLKEGGSLTVIAAMDIASGNKVDDSVVEEFKGTANMELTLDASLAQAGVVPPILLQRSFTKNSDLLLDDRQKEGLALIRQLLGTTSSAVAIPQLVSMMEKTATNQDLLLKMKDWFALMNM